MRALPPRRDAVPHRHAMHTPVAPVLLIIQLPSATAPPLSVALSFYRY